MKPCDAILAALRQGHNTKTKALREAWFLAPGEGQHELSCYWHLLAHEGRIVRHGRAWAVVESEVQP